jgi:hypothetical protein
LCDEEIQRYDAAPAKAHLRTDFLSQLRQKKGSIGPDSPHENLINHLGNNLYEPPCTFTFTHVLTLMLVLRSLISAINIHLNHTSLSPFSSACDSSSLSPQLAFIHNCRLACQANFFSRLAGSDTTGISLRACFYYVLKNSRVLAKLRDEISTFQASGQLSDPVTLEETLKMPYLYDYSDFMTGIS